MQTFGLVLVLTAKYLHLGPILILFGPDYVFVSYPAPLFLPEVTCPGTYTQPTPAVAFVWHTALLVRNFATNQPSFFYHQAPLWTQKRGPTCGQKQATHNMKYIPRRWSVKNSFQNCLLEWNNGGWRSWHLWENLLGGWRQWTRQLAGHAVVTVWRDGQRQAGGRVDALKNHFFHCYPFGCRCSLAHQQRDEKVPGAEQGPFTRHSSSLCRENEPISISDWRDNVLNRRACRVTMRRKQKGPPPRLSLRGLDFMLQ